MSKLLERISTVSHQARASGHLLSLPTEIHHVQEGEFKFVVRVLGNLKRKSESKAKDPNFNPFLPYEKELFVGDAPPRHALLLNKFNVVHNHLLIVTREFEDQTSLLTKHDFEAMWSVLKDFDGLAFYNGGQIAGASQRHKHLQVVPTPLEIGSSMRTPFDKAISRSLEGSKQEEIRYCEAFPFVHTLTSTADCRDLQAAEAAELSFERYLSSLARLSDELMPSAALTSQMPYNMLATRDWMLMVPRKEECFKGISMNSLAFAGCLLVPQYGLLETMRSHGPMACLTAVCFKL
eukprot:CAMPEP_0113971544 /NCGR_PEP_ID=MMETSP0011_2-20120614/12380_1 /TAXON_ID=101924 /ORGANISM="Rhodosorus marinus" /LENGTH=292 /DNA_ID=CAMNT_0000987221 /DNA_START=75 /DNA_END=953 /DNA_ORIENTATION=- /assembly_acc=CAM_ASM_000156